MNQFTDWLKNEMDRRNLNAKELSELASVSRANISTILNGKTRPGFDFCKAIAQAFNISTVQVLRIAELIEEEDEENKKYDSIITEIIEEARTLNTNEKEQLLNFARFLHSQK